ncbi:Mrr restriction system protein [uncultured Leptolyngbya sp.]|uniref:Mrr restriction system protein n=1 Tax=uncultured Leptolyngbya sp. TaxID=332963 RepID=A0A6J4LZC3_9CYAN|nr:Mrr restriction system protein [uncultured Leptolyngbya sp.]
MGDGGSIKDAGQAVGRSGDGGIDGIIKEDNLIWMLFISKPKDGRVL